jgi:UDP-glucose 6-dehydrogenase
MATAADAVAGADCLLILTDWDEFAAPAAGVLESLRGRVVIDGVGVLDRSRLDTTRIRYVTMGRG